MLTGHCPLIYVAVGELLLIYKLQNHSSTSHFNIIDKGEAISVQVQRVPGG